MPCHWYVVSFTPLDCLQILLGSESDSLAVANEPYRVGQYRSFFFSGHVIFRSKLTDWPFMLLLTLENCVKFFLAFVPLSRSQRHLHCPQTPTQERNPFQLLFCESSTSTEHTGLNGEVLNRKCVDPVDMICND
jgi:hypothetical protein